MPQQTQHSPAKVVLGLALIGVDLYPEGLKAPGFGLGDPELLPPGSHDDITRDAWAHTFLPIWEAEDDDDREWVRNELGRVPRWSVEFGRALADAQWRVRGIAP
jgi:hypothetical protein